MLRDRYAPVDLFGLVPALMLRFEPELAELDRLLEDDQLFLQIKADLSRRRPHTLETGRPSTPVEVVLRLLAIPRLYRWSYEQTQSVWWGDSQKDTRALESSCRHPQRLGCVGPPQRCAGHKEQRDEATGIALGPVIPDLAPCAVLGAMPQSVASGRLRRRVSSLGARFLGCRRRPVHR